MAEVRGQNDGSPRGCIVSVEPVIRLTGPDAMDHEITHLAEKFSYTYTMSDGSCKSLHKSLHI